MMLHLKTKRDILQQKENNMHAFVHNLCDFMIH
jgi:hypothetical protein